MASQLKNNFPEAQTISEELENKSLFLKNFTS